LGGEQWLLYGFMDAVREWLRHDPPPRRLGTAGAEFGAARRRDPTGNADREHANLWYRELPGTVHDGWIVSVTFTVEAAHDPTFVGEVHCQTVCCVPHPWRGTPPPWPPPAHHGG